MCRSLRLLLVGTLAVAAAWLPARAAAQATERDLVLSKSRPPERRDVPRGYAVIVGVASYAHLDASKQLRFPESDAEAMYRVLIDHAGGAFPAENVHLLVGRDATLANVTREIEEWLPSVAQPSDRVVVYFAGHGFLQDGKGYLAPWDVQPDRLAETAYPMARLGEVLATRVKAEWKVLLADACHSGAITGETTTPALEAQFGALPRSFLTLTATSDREQSFEDQGLSTGFGLFTYFLVQAFRGNADSDPCDGRITADELVTFVRSGVRRYARQRQLTQTPTARGDFEPDMVLGVGTGCLPGADAQAPSLLGTAIIEVNTDDVDLYIDGRLVGRLSRETPLVVPSLSSGLHEFRGVKAGYEPDRKDVMIAPGQEVAVSIRIRYPRQVSTPGLEADAEGQRLLYARRSSLSLLNLAPVERKQSEADLRRAAALFERALVADPSFALAAYHLGQARHLLREGDAAARAFRTSIALDPSALDPRLQYAGVLIEQGDADEAIRQLTEARRLKDADSSDDLHAMLARAFWEKGAWEPAVASADLALLWRPSNAQAHLWKADALRHLAAADSDPGRQRARYAVARDEYRAFVELTNFSSGLGARLAFHFVGLGVGRRAHADRQAAYDSLRSAGFLGLCLTEQKVGNPLRARQYCQRALRHTPDDPIALFLLGNVNRDLFNARQCCDCLTAARASYVRMVAVNPRLDEASHARDYIAQIDDIAPRAGCGTARTGR
ncbi:hypothetical protein TBR22_A10070 [Luteitalea sp. TBR-22]|uniref:caspase family protein n=1 Tax=Luteitalea sp. TBR-22 TaxID=2802971 RepID=UPI001AF57EB3|nr:caspase family protein [Luteitalea sp. TBR-22]BCS31803.1 hypothetical protein TBR22_A10070 [Luteitalea sp. TBR-22]